MRAGGRRALVAAVVAAVLAGGLVVAAPGPGARADDPTWAEVQAAKRDVTRKAGEVARIRQALDDLEAEAARLGAVAVQRAAASTAAAGRLAAAQAVTDRLDAQVKAARGRAGEARTTAGTVAAQLYRSGDPTLSVWLAGDHPGSLLYRLGTLTRIGDSSSELLAAAVVEERQAKALGAEAAAQAAVRDRLATQARTLADQARTAEDSAQAQVAATAARRRTLEAQLTSLQATRDSLAASYASAQAAKRAAAAAGEGGGGNAALGGIAGPDSLSPAGAQAYAASRLGGYGWDGGQQPCLVKLWNIESGWRWNAYNASSGAYGIPQSLPGSKLAAAGADWTTSSKTQIEWGLGYIKARYGSPCAALAFETSHVPYWY